MNTSTISRITNYIRASYPAVAIETSEELRAQGDVIEAAKASKRAVVVWSATSGLERVTEGTTVADTEDLLAAVRQRFKKTVYIFRDVQTWPLDRDPVLLRAVRDLLSWAPSEGSSVVLLGVKAPLQPSIEKLVTVIDYGLPTATELGTLGERIAKGNELKAEADELILRALSGLSFSEAENALALSVVETGTFDAEVIYREKIQAVRKSGLLEIVTPDPRGLDAIGGLEVLKTWIRRRLRAFTKEAREYGLPAPKGILILGVPGTGKSLAAKCIGTALKVPTLRMDIGALFNSLVGESESRTRDALKTAEAIAPVILFIDELDKGMAGSSGAGAGDSGVTKRVLGTILTWLQEKSRPVFLVASANDVSALPPELLRKGRWDEIFAVDLPNEQERAAIFAIHLTARGREPGRFGFDPGKTNGAGPVLDATDGFTGAEIEAVVVEAMYNAFDEDREVGPKDLLVAAQSTMPLSKTAKESIERLRAWAQGRARFASAREMTSVTQKARRLSV